MIKILIIFFSIIILFIFSIYIYHSINTKKVDINKIKKNLLYNKKIVVTFLVRDGDKYLKKNVLKINNFLSKYFKEYQIIYFENNSKDNTKKILSDLEKIIPIKGIKQNLKIKNSINLCNYNRNCNKRKRLLALFRQKLLNIIKNNYHNYDYMLMMDMDFIDFNEKDLLIMMLLSVYNKLDAIFGMSIYKTIKYTYDTAAIKNILNQLYYILFFKKNNTLTHVNSAFSGFGLYSIKSILLNNANYNLKTNNIEHIDFNKSFNCYIYNNFTPSYNII